MKYIFSLLYAIATLFFASCNTTIHCTHPYAIMYFSIPDFDTLLPSTLRVVRYQSGTQYVVALDSTDLLLSSPFNISIPADATKDYQIVLLPQNRKHQLQNVKFGQEKRIGSPGRDSEQCKTSISFTYDGVEKEIPWRVGSASGGGYLNTLNLSFFSTHPRLQRICSSLTFAT